MPALQDARRCCHRSWSPMFGTFGGTLLPSPYYVCQDRTLPEEKQGWIDNQDQSPPHLETSSRWLPLSGGEFSSSRPCPRHWTAGRKGGSVSAKRFDQKRLPWNIWIELFKPRLYIFPDSPLMSLKIVYDTLCVLIQVYAPVQIEVVFCCLDAFLVLILNGHHLPWCWQPCGRPGSWVWLHPSLNFTHPSLYAGCTLTWNTQGVHFVHSARILKFWPQYMQYKQRAVQTEI